MDRIIWMFINKENPQNIINVVGTECARQMVSLMHADDWQNWYVRRQNWPKAKLLKNADELTMGLKARETNSVKDVLIELPSSEEALQGHTFNFENTLLKSTPTPTPTPVKKVSGTDWEERRKYPRFDFKFRVVIISDGRIFRTYTKNISLGGVLINTSIPKDIKSMECKVILGRDDSKENIETEASFVGNSSSTCRLRFNEKNASTFQSKLQAWITQMQKGKKAA